MKNKYVRVRVKASANERVEAGTVLKQHTHTSTLIYAHIWNWKRKYFAVTCVFLTLLTIGTAWPRAWKKVKEADSGTLLVVLLIRQPQSMLGTYEHMWLAGWLAVHCKVVSRLSFVSDPNTTDTKQKLSWPKPNELHSVQISLTFCAINSKIAYFWSPSYMCVGVGEHP